MGLCTQHHTSSPCRLLLLLSHSYYAGKLGTTALAALGSNGALFSVLYFLCFTALAVLCTQVSPFRTAVLCCGALAVLLCSVALCIGCAVMC